MITAALITLAVVKSWTPTVEPNPRHSVDLIELNHVVKWEGDDKGFEENLTQLIFWRWEPADFGPRAKIKDWVIVTADKKGRLELPPMRLKDGKLIMRIEFQGVDHIVTGTHFRETWTQYDPEVDERKLFGDREGLWR